jgi:prefoldin subunit 5
VQNLEERVAELETELESIQDEQRRMREAYNQIADLIEGLRDTSRNA